MKYKVVRKKHPTEKRDRTPIIFDDSLKAAEFIVKYIGFGEVERVEECILDAQSRSDSPNPQQRVDILSLNHRGAFVDVRFIKESV